MSDLRRCPICSRSLEVADDGTIPTWVVTWGGQEAVFPSKRGKYPLAKERYARLLELRAKYPDQAHLQEPPQEPKGCISNRTSCFIHGEDAQAEYTWIKNILTNRGDWDEQQQFLTLTDGDRASWSDLFEPSTNIWTA